MAADLSVVVVNYRSGPLLAEALASIESLAFAVGGRPGTAETIVVDNASGPADDPFLAALDGSARVIRNPQNLGFGTACNQGWTASSGERVCFLNPDARLLPGALERLVAALDSSPDVGAVGPAFWGDEERLLRLPPNQIPTAGGLLAETLGAALPWVGRRVSGSWTRRSLSLWNATAPVEVEMLSGACLLTRRATLEAVGGFDEGFFLYFEDADWCRRARRRGLRLLHVPGAHVVHYFNQSARQVPAEALQWAQASLARYEAKHFGRLGRWLLRTGRAKAGPAARPPATPVDLGSLHEPPLLEVQAPGPAGFQFAYNWIFVPHVAAFPPGPAFRLPERVWSRMMPARYFARAIDLRTAAPLADWTWLKPS